MIASASARDMLDSGDQSLHSEAMAKAREAAEMAAQLEAQAHENALPLKRMKSRSHRKHVAKQSTLYRPRNKFVSDNNI
jgi:hypothetical protein